MPIWYHDPTTPFVPPPTRAYAHLTVLSATLTSGELASMLPIPIDEAWERGDGRRPLPYSGVDIRSRSLATARPGDHLTELLLRLREGAVAIRALHADPRIHSVRLWLVFEIANVNPGIELTASHIEGPAELDLGLDIDVYVFDEPPENDDA